MARRTQSKSPAPDLPDSHDLIRVQGARFNGSDNAPFPTAPSAGRSWRLNRRDRATMSLSLRCWRSRSESTNRRLDHSRYATTVGASPWLTASLSAYSRPPLARSSPGHFSRASLMY